MGKEEVLPNGVKLSGLMDETSQRGFWSHYREVMAAGQEAFA